MAVRSVLGSHGCQDFARAVMAGIAVMSVRTLLRQSWPSSLKFFSWLPGL